MPTSNPKIRFLLLPLCLGLVSLAMAAPKFAAKKPAKPAASAPVDLGNGIFILGDDSGEAQPLASKPASTPTPARVSRAASPNLNAALVRFCRSNLGRKIGNGQCSELVVWGLPTIGARLDFNNQWGTPVCNYIATNGRQYLQLAPAGKTRGNPRKANLKAGDIIQYENVKFERRWNGGNSYSFQDYPHHTSVIEQVSRDGNTLKVLEQNVNNTQFVVETVLYLPDQTQGVLRVSRPLAR
ncbi:CHAP domain-containing protein [bacterium]|nr:MAG: CHAP domain-containing protein [bacterium]